MCLESHPLKHRRREAENSTSFHPYLRPRGEQGRDPPSSHRTPAPSPSTGQTGPNVARNLHPQIPRAPGNVKHSDKTIARKGGGETGKGHGVSSRRAPPSRTAKAHPKPDQVSGLPCPESAQPHSRPLPAPRARHPRTCLRAPVRAPARRPPPTSPCRPQPHPPRAPCPPRAHRPALRLLRAPRPGLRAPGPWPRPRLQPGPAASRHVDGRGRERQAPSGLLPRVACRLRPGPGYGEGNAPPASGAGGLQGSRRACLGGPGGDAPIPAGARAEPTGRRAGSVTRRGCRCRGRAFSSPAACRTRSPPCF